MKFPKSKTPTKYDYGCAIDSLANIRYLMYTYKISYQYLAYLLEMEEETCEELIDNKTGIPADKVCRIIKVNNYLMRTIEEIQEEAF